MDPITRPIRVIYDTKSWEYRSKTWLAYLGVFGLACGDTLRYTIGWTGMGIWSGVLFIATLWMLARSQPMATIKRIPWSMIALYAALLLSAVLSNYWLFSVGAVVVTAITGTFGLWLAHAFDWRHLLRIFANVSRFVLGSSLLFEFYAAAILRGRILSGLDFLGVRLDDARNAAGQTRLTADGAPVTAWIVPAAEEAQIASPHSNTRLPFNALFYPVDALKSGMHHPDGIFWIRAPGLTPNAQAGRIELTKVGAALLEKSGLMNAQADATIGS